MNTNSNYSICPSDEWLRKAAAEEDKYESVSVGGLAHDLGMLRAASPTPSGVFGQLVEYARRRAGLSCEELAERIKVDLAELVAIERNDNMMPGSRTVFQLATFCGMPVGRLMEIAGLAEPKDQVLSSAAVRFAARSEPNAKLTADEEQAFDEFVKVIVHSPPSI